jgi:nucleoside-diphosphate-sugar epimerase
MTDKKKMRVAITGSAGYLASLLLPLLQKDNSVEEIIGIDIAEHTTKYSKLRYIRQSILETDKLTKIFKNADCVVHMAFNITGMHDKSLLERINVDGSRSVMKAVADSGSVKKLVFTSSIAAYGAHRDNPVPLKETHPLRGKGTFFYADQKHRLEEDLDKFEKENPKIDVVRLRLCTTTGPTADNETVTVYRAPVFIAFPFNQPKVQLMHEEDAARGFHLSIIKKVRGAFNLGSDWDYTSKEHAKLAGIKIIIYIPVWLAKALARTLWTFRLIKFDPAWIKASLYPVVVDTKKAEKELGWKPKYKSAEIINSIIKKSN